MTNMTRAARPEMYVSRFEDKSRNRLDDLSKTPLEELFAMLALEADGRGFKNGSVLWREHLQDRCSVILGRRYFRDLEGELSAFVSKNAPASSGP